MRGTMKVTWRGPAFDRRLEAHLKRNLADATGYLRDTIVADIDTPGFAVIQSHGGRPYRQINLRHSRPGDPPYEQTAELIRSIRVVPDRYRRLTCYLAVRAEYTLALELGRPEIKLKPRPFIRRNFFGEQARIGRIICRPM